MKVMVAGWPGDDLGQGGDQFPGHGGIAEFAGIGAHSGSTPSASSCRKRRRVSCGVRLVELLDGEAGVDQHEVTDPDVLDHHQARLALDAVDLAEGGLPLDVHDPHGDAKAHGLLRSGSRRVARG